MICLGYLTWDMEPKMLELIDELLNAEDSYVYVY